MRVFLALAPLSLFALLLSACDTFIDYTVVNESDLTLLTRASDESCGHDVYDGDVTDEDHVPARDTLGYSFTTGVFDAKCVQVYTEAGELVLAESYRYNGTPTQPTIIGLTQTSDNLPRQNWFDGTWDTVVDYPVATLFLLLVLGTFLAVPVAIVIGVVLGIRATLRPRRSEKS
jgi:hypothetical protein